MVYLTWMVVALLALTGLVLLLFVPGVGVLAALVLAAALIGAIVLGIGRGVADVGDTTPDVIERRDEHRARRRRDR